MWQRGGPSHWFDLYLLLGAKQVVCSHAPQISGANPDGAAARAGWHAMVVAAPARRVHLRLTGTTTKLMPTVSVDRRCPLAGAI